MMPCVDDPVAKASFRLTVVHPTNTVCQSNTIVNDVQVILGKETTMSTERQFLFLLIYGS